MALWRAKDKPPVELVVANLVELQLNNERETQKISQSSFYKERRSQIAAEKSLGNEQNSWLFFFWVLSEKQL